tara:strand:+ start:1052 stop:1675 length:624 start_codon:yes stop_codon:yes gene_type:complete
MATPTYPLTMPTTPGFTTSEWQIIRQVSMTQSPFTMAQQVAEFQGSVWSTIVTLPPMKRSQAGVWQAFFMQLHGKNGTFLIGDPDGKTLIGSLTNTIQVNGDHSVGAFDVVIDGADVSTTIFKAGDYVQFGSGASSKLHMIISDVTSDSSGNATLPIEPPLKSSLSDDASIVTSSTKAVMRMNSNELGWSASKISLYGISFACTEAL